MEFGIEKCVMLLMKIGRREMMVKMELQNQNRMRLLRENENYKCLGILEVDTIKRKEMKEKIRKKNHRHIRKLIETQLCSKYFIKGINIWAVILVRYF